MKKTALHEIHKDLNAKMIDFAGSDIHNINHIDSFQNKIKTKYDDEVQKILEKNKLFE